MSIFHPPLWGLNEDQVEELDKLLPAEVVSHRETYPGSKLFLDYVEGWWVIHEANRIFGFAGWQPKILDLRLVNESEHIQSTTNKKGWIVSYLCLMEISVHTEEGWLSRQDVGFGEGIDYSSLGRAHESAGKEAVTDALKRVFKDWGNRFGLALYDKTKQFVSSEVTTEEPSGKFVKEKPSPPLTKKVAKEIITDTEAISDIGDTIMELSTELWKLNPDRYPKAIVGATRTYYELFKQNMPAVDEISSERAIQLIEELKKQIEVHSAEQD